MSLVEQDVRRRLWWSYVELASAVLVRLLIPRRTYCLDRSLTIALGRPPSIPEEWMSVAVRCGPLLMSLELTSTAAIVI
jgi:hypothetical protein